MEVIQLVKDSISIEMGFDYYAGIRLESIKGRRTKLIHCIFHHERTPSLILTPSKNVFNCFGCHAHGDIVTLVSMLRGVSQARAAYIICEDFNLLDRPDKELQAVRKKAAGLELERKFKQMEKEVLFFLINFKNTIRTNAKQKIKTPGDLDKFERTYGELLPQLDMFIDCLDSAEETQTETRVSNYYAAQEFIGKRIYPIYKAQQDKSEEQGVGLYGQNRDS
jgi:hypothetical protein